MTGSVRRPLAPVILRARPDARPRRGTLAPAGTVRAGGPGRTSRRVLACALRRMCIRTRPRGRRAVGLRRRLRAVRTLDRPSRRRATGAGRGLGGKLWARRRGEVRGPPPFEREGHPHRQDDRRDQRDRAHQHARGAATRGYRRGADDVEVRPRIVRHDDGLLDDGSAQTVAVGGAIHRGAEILVDELREDLVRPRGGDHALRPDHDELRVRRELVGDRRRGRRDRGIDHDHLGEAGLGEDARQVVVVRGGTEDLEPLSLEEVVEGTRADGGLGQDDADRAFRRPAFRM
jgi:hypothetical protein